MKNLPKKPVSSEEPEQSCDAEMYSENFYNYDIESNFCTAPWTVHPWLLDNTDDLAAGGFLMFFFLFFARVSASRIFHPSHKNPGETVGFVGYFFEDFDGLDYLTIIHPSMLSRIPPRIRSLLSFFWGGKCEVQPSFPLLCVCSIINESIARR